MIQFLKILSIYEGKIWCSYRQTFFLLSFVFHMMMILMAALTPENTLPMLTPFSIILLLLILNFQGTFWIEKAFFSSHFCHLSLQPNAFTWSLLIKIWVTSLGFMAFTAVHCLPWILGGTVDSDILTRFIFIIPYFISLQSLIVSLTQGHLQTHYLGLLLMLPLQIPVLLFMFSKHSLPFMMWMILPWLLTFTVSWVLRKIIQIQAIL